MRRRGRFKRILIVALARKLLVALWRYLASGIVPEGAAGPAIAWEKDQAPAFSAHGAAQSDASRFRHVFQKVLSATSASRPAA